MYRRRIRTGKSKYSNTSTNISIKHEGSINKGVQITYPIVPTSTTFGTRKVKNMTITIDQAGFAQPLLWALVYRPDGTSLSNLTVDGYDATAQNPSIPEIYRPNQNVIMQGIIDPANNIPIRITTRLARNLDSGDTIYLVVTPYLDDDTTDDKYIIGTVNYSIKF